MEYIICKYCIVEKGIIGSELKKRNFTTVKDLANHIESEHHIPVAGKEETEEECKERFYKIYPEAKNTETCKCPWCLMNRRMKESLFDIVRQN